MLVNDDESRGDDLVEVIGGGENGGDGGQEDQVSGSRVGNAGRLEDNHMLPNKLGHWDRVGFGQSMKVTSEGVNDWERRIGGVGEVEDVCE